MKFIFFTNKSTHPSSRGDNSKIMKIYGEYLKKIFFRTSGPVSTKLGIKHPWVEEIKILFSNKESCFSTRGDNSLFVKWYWKHVKIYWVSDVAHGPLVFLLNWFFEGAMWPMRLSFKKWSKVKVIRYSVLNFQDKRLLNMKPFNVVQKH